MVIEPQPENIRMRLIHQRKCRKGLEISQPQTETGISLGPFRWKHKYSFLWHSERVVNKYLEEIDEEHQKHEQITFRYLAMCSAWHLDIPWPFRLRLRPSFGLLIRTPMFTSGCIVTQRLKLKLPLISSTWFLLNPSADSADSLEVWHTPWSSTVSNPSYEEVVTQANPFQHIPK